MPCNLVAYDFYRYYLSGVGEAAVEVALVDPVLEVADPEGSDLFKGGGLVVAMGGGDGGGGGGGRGCGPGLVVGGLHPLVLLERGIHGALNKGLCSASSIQAPLAAF